NNSATAGSMTVFNLQGALLGIGSGFLIFNDGSNASSATMNNNGATAGGFALGGETQFNSVASTVFSSAASATINNNGAAFAEGGGFTDFHGFSTAGSATINNDS